MSYNVTRLKEANKSAFQQLYSQCANTTFQHSLEFMDYHKDRFEDYSVLILEDETPKAYLLAARDPLNHDVVVSHPGATFSGLVMTSDTKGAGLTELLESVLSFYQLEGFRTLIYKDVPQIYCSNSKGDFTYAAFRNQSTYHMVQLSAVIDLTRENFFSSRRIRILKKNSSQLAVSNGWSNLNRYWDVLSNNLWDKFRARPVHTLAEIELLKERFDDSIELFTATQKDQNEIIAGILVFKSSRVWKAQYISSSILGRDFGAVDFLIEKIMNSARAKAANYLDLGTSNENSGMVLNENLYNFKLEFGAEGLAYEQFRFEF
jgi:hypothetical protein